MNETINTLFQHRTIRTYKSSPIDDAVLQEILLAGVRASTTGNMQLYSIIVNKDEAKKEALAPFHFNQPSVKQAPVLLTFCADLNRFNKWCEYRNAKPAYDNFLWYINAAIDALLAAQNCCVAAEAHGLGICYLGTTTYMADKFIEALKLPKGVVPVTAVTVGYAEETPALTDRLPLEAVIHYENYKDYTETDINNLYAEKEQLEETKQLIKENGTENLAQVFTEKRYKKDDNLHFSKSYINVLKQQGFMNQ